MELDGKVLENVHNVSVAENNLSDLKRTADSCQQMVEQAAREKNNADSALKGAWETANRNVADMKAKIMEATQRMAEFENAVVTQQEAINPRMDRTKKSLDDIQSMLDVCLSTIGSGVLSQFSGQINDEAQVAIRHLQEKLDERRKAIQSLMANIKASREKAHRIRGALNSDIDAAYNQLREKMDNRMTAARDAIDVFEKFMNMEALTSPPATRQGNSAGTDGLAGSRPETMAGSME